MMDLYHCPGWNARMQLKHCETRRAEALKPRRRQKGSLGKPVNEGMTYLDRERCGSCPGAAALASDASNPQPIPAESLGIRPAPVKSDQLVLDPPKPIRLSGYIQRGQRVEVATVERAPLVVRREREGRSHGAVGKKGQPVDEAAARDELARLEGEMVPVTGKLPKGSLYCERGHERTQGRCLVCRRIQEKIRNLKKNLGIQ